MDIHKYTWECPGRQLKSLIDYILVRKNIWPLVCDVKVVRGAEIGSDHYLVLMKMRKWRKAEEQRTSSRRTMVRTEKLKVSEVRLRFQGRLQLKMKRSAEVNSGEVEKVWREFKESMMSTVIEVCGTKQCGDRQKRTGWWNEEVRTTVKRKKRVYKRWLQLKTTGAKEEYTEAKNEAKRVVRKAHNKEWSELYRQGTTRGFQQKPEEILDHSEGAEQGKHRWQKGV